MNNPLALNDPTGLNPASCFPANLPDFACYTAAQWCAIEAADALAGGGEFDACQDEEGPGTSRQGGGSGTKKTNCTKARIALAIKGVISLGVAKAKLDAALSTLASSAGDGPVGIVGAIYGLLGAGGNFAAGVAQLTGAVTGDVKASAEAATYASTVTTVAGLYTYKKTKGNLEAASTAAAIESIGTSGFNGGKSGQFIEEGLNKIDKLFAGTELAQNGVEAAGISTTPKCQ
jgi:hypothetical protein